MSFKVTDKRFSSESGFEENDSMQCKTEISGNESSAGDVNFGTFILSIATAAMVALGEIPNPVSKENEENLEIARYNINLLSLLKEKTKNNVSQDEENLLDNVLYSLRMKFIQKKGL